LTSTWHTAGLLDWDWKAVFLTIRLSQKPGIALLQRTRVLVNVFDNFVCLGIEDFRAPAAASL